MNPFNLFPIAVCAIVVALTATSLAAESQQQPTLERAREQVRDGRLEGALELYDQLLQHAPEDQVARLERARVLGWMGRHERSLGDIDAVLARDAADADARLERARVLGWMGRHAEAEEELAHVLAAQPDRLDAQLLRGDLHAWQGRHERAADAYGSVLEIAREHSGAWARLGRVREWQGLREESRAAYAEALRLAPDDRESREALRRLERGSVARRFRVDAGVRFDDLSGSLSDWWHEHVVLSFSPTEHTRVVAAVDQYRRFDEDDTQLTLGGGVALGGDWAADGRVTFGVDVDVVAREVFELGVGRRLGEVWRAELRYRRSQYPGDVATDAFIPLVSVSPSSLLRLDSRYYLTRVTGGRLGHAGSLRLELLPDGRLSPQLGVAYGSEAFEAASGQELLTRARVFTASAGLRLLLSDRLGIRVDFEYEDREDSYERRGVGSGLFVTF
jgi:YaiO family outer membrane protein